MDDEENPKKSSLSSSIMDDITAAATGYADYKKNKEAASANKKDSAKSSLSSAENSALKPTSANNNSPLASARSAESSPSSLYTGTGRSLNSPSNPKNEKSSIQKALPAALIGVLVLGIMGLVFILQPIMKLGSIIRNLSTALGFDHSTALLEEKCEYVTQEMAMNGKINENFYARLSENNIEVGQVTASGDFVKTNTYLAYLDEDIASTDNSYHSDKTGPLSFRFNGKIIAAENFVAAVESDPALYDAFSDSLNVSSEYYFSDEVEGVYNQLGITRTEFIDYEETDDNDENYKNFSELVAKFLDKGGSTTIQVVRDDNTKDCRGSGEEIATGSLGGNGLVSAVEDATSDYELSKTGYDEETGKPIYECLKVENSERHDEAAALLSTALSSLEPYEATKAFMVVAEPIQQVQAGDNGPIHQLMNMLDVSTPISINNMNGGGTIETDESIMTNGNFLAAITLSEFDAEEAYNFSRDRTLITTNAGNLDTLKKINSATPTQQSASRNSYYGANWNENLYNAGDVYEKSVYTKKSETFTSTVGANQIVEGGAFLNNAINSTIGAFASDSATVAEYQKEVNKIFARQAAAERATLAWYDISSKNTFLGSIVYNFATAMTYFSAKANGNLSLSTIPESIASVTKNSIASVTGLVSADNYEDGYLGTNAIAGACKTVEGINYGLVSDIYCTEHKTIDTQNISYVLSDFARELGGQIDHSTGEIRKESGWLLETLVLGADRSTSVGASNSEICRRKENDFSNFFKRIYNKVRGMLGVSDCEKAGEDIATGAKYTFSSNNKEEDLKHAHLASAYALYQMANKIVGNANQVSIAKEKYYAEHPLDNSEAGYIARISGMTKEQAEIALAYADYLTYLAKYDPSTRYSFINPAGLESSPLDSLEFNEELANTYALVSKEIAYSDIRNRLVALS